MLLHTVYTVVTPANMVESFLPPPPISLNADTIASFVEQESGIQLHIDRKIDHTKLELVEVSGRYKKPPDGTEEPVPTLRLVEDEALENILSQDFISALTFLTDVSIALSRPHFNDRFVPETDEDRKLLERLGTDQPYHRYSAQAKVRSFSTDGITTKTITDLMPRRVGLRLYANAMKANLAVAQLHSFANFGVFLKPHSVNRVISLWPCLLSMSLLESLTSMRPKLNNS